MSGRSAPAWLWPALLALPFLIGVAVLQGLTVEIDTFHGSDARIYQLPTIQLLSERLDFDSYPSAQTPLYHLVMAGWGKLVGFDLWKLRLLNVAISYAAVLVLMRLLRRAARLDPLPAFALALVFALSPYYFGASFTLLTDNLAILFMLLALERFDRLRTHASLPVFAAGAVAVGAALLTRQSFAWLVLVAAYALLRAPFSWRRRLAGAAALALALAPFAALVVHWGGLVPPTADPASCGLCTDRPGVGRDALTLRTVGFTVALFGAYAAAIFGPGLLRRLPRAELVPSARELAIAIGAAVVLLAVSPLSYQEIVPGQAGDAGYLWKVSDRFPDVLGTSLVFWALVPLGAAALVVLATRAGVGSLAVVSVASFLAAALPVRLVYQKYFDPFALFLLALLARPPDLRRPADYSGIALLCAAFVAYALSFAG
jgi:4-amino-4-deoxy-L-arabinose transferase-like glycosyltransferase